MGFLSELVAPLFRQSRYVRPGGQEYFEHTSMNIIKCPYTTGALAGLFYQAATGAPLETIVPIIIGGGIVQFLKSSDNDAFNQFRPGGRDKVIDKRPCRACSEPTPPDYMRQAKGGMISSGFIAAVLGGVSFAGIAGAIRTGLPIGENISPIILAITSYQAMRFFRFREVVKGNWVILKSPPRHDEPLYPTPPASDAAPK